MMKLADQKSETLSQAIMKEAQAEAEQVLAAAHAKAVAVRRQAQERADAERKAILDKGSQEVARLRSQAIATAQLKARTIELEHREKLLNEVFNAARQQLEAAPRNKHYAQITRRLLKEALAYLRTDSVIIHADPATQTLLTGDFVDDLAQELHLQIQIGEPLENKTGVIVETEDGHLNYDNTLENRLNRLQSMLRYSVYQLLLGEEQ